MNIKRKPFLHSSLAPQLQGCLHTSVISTSSRRFTCPRGCCFGGGGAARTCREPKRVSKSQIHKDKVTNETRLFGTDNWAGLTHRANVAACVSWVFGRLRSILRGTWTEKSHTVREAGRQMSVHPSIQIYVGILYLQKGFCVLQQNVPDVHFHRQMLP